ncbi:hypothetical protein K435DRAFT_871546 [Dendrothele bispora CBS 962.96]|uniref:Uncharacterized protein n=1 Tax=Dendrothele bispora (strain CBS 962.96) TaxID=1314807 RepID=A0A4S8L3U1_DENBC|nr:hypothetical protein K435DRAFT_871546 [Dendrothele bispora CBS 962.96]
MAGSLVGGSVDGGLATAQILKDWDSSTPQINNLIMNLPLLFTNMIATLLVGHKTWYHYQDVKKNLSNSGTSSRKVQKVLLLLVESGSMYCIFWIVNIIISFKYDETTAIYQCWVAAVPGLSALYPVLIIVIAAAENAKSAAIDEMSLSQSIRTLTETSSDLLAEPFSDYELKYPDEGSDVPRETISGGIGQYVLDHELIDLRSILDRMRNEDSVYNALSDLGKLLGKYIPEPRNNVPLIDQDPNDENKTIERIKVTYIRELFRTDNKEEEIWEISGAKLFYTPEEWRDIVKTSTEITLPATPVTPKKLKAKASMAQIPASSDTTDSTAIESPLSPSPSYSTKATFGDRFAAHHLSVLPPRVIEQTYSEPTVLPALCQVTNKSLQDRLLVKEGIDYATLPPLKAGALVSWNSSATRKGHVMFSEWQSLGNAVDVLFLVDWFKFTRLDTFINPARINPQELTAYNPSSNYARRVLYTRDTHNPAICLIPIHVELSILTTFAQTSSSSPKRFRKVDGLLHSQDADRIIGAITMVLGEGNSEMAADIIGDVLTFSTRFEPSQVATNRGAPAPQNRIFSASTSGSSTS